jgi:hypothetical protein
MLPAGCVYRAPANGHVLRGTCHAASGGEASSFRDVRSIGLGNKA